MVDHYIYDLEDTWNDAGTTFFAISMDVTNTASANGSSLLWLGVGGVSKFSVDPNGMVNVPAGNSNNERVKFSTSIGDYAIFVRDDGYDVNYIGFGESGKCLVYFYHRLPGGVYANFTIDYSTGMSQIGWVADRNSPPDLGVARVGNAILKVTDGTEAGIGALEVSYVRTRPLTVVTLPVAATAGDGARAFVTDALTPVYGATVVGGGAVKTPVYSDGTNWIVG